MIAVDLPGHGNSLPAEDKNVYALPGYALEIRNFISENKLQGVILVGWSLGGHIAIEAMDMIPELIGIVIFGTPPLGLPPRMEEAFLPNEAVNFGFMKDLEEEQAVAYAKSFFQQGSEVKLEPFVTQIKNTDGNARSGLMESMQTIGYKDEILALENTNLPILVMHGENEQLVNLEYIKTLKIPTLWQNKVFEINNSGHAPHVENSKQFNMLLHTFTMDI